jgi:UDP-GlcNAc:undecaprenyl-phosphate GlcNAc-1-phosphate transferase
MNQTAIAFFLSLAATALLTPLVMVAARRFDLVARPRVDRWHTRTVALMGGIAILLGTLGTWLCVADISHFATPVLLAVAMFGLGLVDDLRDIRPYLKLIVQFACSAFLVTSGVVFWQFPYWLSLPITLVWIIGITNAINLLDNMDGLAAGVSMLSAAATGFYCLQSGAPQIAPLAFAVSGSCAGFLLFNFSPARIFMGDCGSLFLGFILAALTVLCPSRSAPNLLLSLLVPVAVLAIPLFDTALVSVARTFHGRSIAQGGRDHSSHRLVSLGLSERGTVLVLYGLTLLFGVLALVSTRLPFLQVVLLMALLLVGLAVFGVYLGFLKVYTEPYQVPSGIRVIGGSIFYKKQILQVVADNLLAQVAFVGAHLLRFEGQLTPEILHAVLRALPILILAKLFGMAFCRAYRGVWRYAGMDDALRAVVGSIVGSVAAFTLVSLIVGLKDLSRAAFIIDWLFFTGLVVFLRLGYQILRHIFGAFPAGGAPGVVLLGAGEEGIALMSQLRDPHSDTRVRVVGIFDDDPDTHGRLLNGVPVLGPLGQLPAMLENERVQGCLLGVAPHSARATQIIRFCSERSIPLHRDITQFMTQAFAEQIAVSSDAAS